jgi:hypothetical protein
MPSSLIFTGLVVLWLLILVPAIARHQQEVARPSGASLAGRVLDRPRRRIQARRTGRLPTEEGDSVDPERLDQDDTPTAREPERPWVSAARAARLDEAAADEHDEHDDVDERDPDSEPDVADSDDDESDVRWERPPPRYRPGRGGYDPDADAETARARYAFRQRVVLLLLVCALLTGIAAAAAFPVVWWAHGAIDLALVAYLVYLRRQVRLEAAIRERRAARMAGTRRTQAADDRDLDEWARRGREVTRRPSVEDDADPDAEADEAEVAKVADTWVDEDDDATRVRGVGEPVGLLPARRRGVGDENAEPESALPPLQPAPPPPIPPGTSLVVVDDDELDLHDLGTSVRAPHRSAVGE